MFPVVFGHEAFGEIIECGKNVSDFKVGDRAFLQICLVKFSFPYYLEVSKLFVLLNYCCCEHINPIWEKYISKLLNLRKVSISPWCNEELMSEVLKGTKVIFHRKPSPNFI